jgi:regulation of enolase protein 1 (concanavalin A-like superfamily)
MSQGDTNISNANVIDLDSYEELLDKFGRMIKALKKRWLKPRN